MPFPNDVIRNKLALLTMCVIKCFFLTNTSCHTSLLMPSFNAIWSTWATFGLVVVFFLTCIATSLSSSTSLFLLTYQVAYLVSIFFFICSICDTKSFCIKTTDPHLINMLIMLLIWLIVVLLLLQTMHCCHCVFYHDLSERKTAGAKCTQLSVQLASLQWNFGTPKLKFEEKKSKIKRV